MSNEYVTTKQVPSTGPILTAQHVEDAKRQATAAPLPSDPILTTKQVSEQFPFLPEATLRYWRHNSQGPASFTIGKKVLYRRSEIERWLAEQEAATTRGGAA